MKKIFIVFAYWWCIMYPSFSLNTPLSLDNSNNIKQNYEFRFKVTEYINAIRETPFSVNFSS